MVESGSIYATPIGDINAYWWEDRAQFYLGDDGVYQFSYSGASEAPTVQEESDEHSLISWAIIHSALAGHFKLNVDQLDRAIGFAISDYADSISYARTKLVFPYAIDDNFEGAKSAWAIAEMERDEARLRDLSSRLRAQMEPNDMTRRMLLMLKPFAPLTKHLHVLHKDKTFNVFPDPCGGITIHMDRQRIRTEHGSISITCSGTLQPDGTFLFRDVSWGGLRHEIADQSAIGETCRAIISEVVAKLFIDQAFQPNLAWLRAKPRLLSVARAIATGLPTLVDAPSHEPEAIETVNGVVSIEHHADGTSTVRGSQADLHLEVHRASGTRALVQSFSLPVAVTRDGLNAVGHAHVHIQGNKTYCGDQYLIRQVEMFAFEVFQRYRGKDRHAGLTSASL